VSGAYPEGPECQEGPEGPESRKRGRKRGKGNLQTGVKRFVGSGGDPFRRSPRRTRQDDKEAIVSMCGMRTRIEKSASNPNDGSRRSKNAFVECRASGFERDEGGGDEGV